MVAQFIQNLLHCVTNAHILHLQSTSYSQHKALGHFYEDLGKIVDTIAESSQGKYGMITGYSEANYGLPPTNALTYLEEVSAYVQEQRKADGFPQDTEIQNEIDNVQNLVNATIYKLRYLK
jgi:hypothetical protein